MKTISIGDFKTNLSNIAKRVVEGEEFVVTDERKKKIFKVSPMVASKQKKRILGSLEGKVRVVFKGDWQITDDELLRA